MAADKKALSKRVNINLDSALHDRFKAAVASEGKKMTEVLIDFIKRYIQKSREREEASGGKG
jgi:hypothetical protein